MNMIKLDTKEVLWRTNGMEKEIIEKKYHTDFEYVEMPAEIADALHSQGPQEEIAAIIAENTAFTERMKQVEGIVSAYMPAKEPFLRFFPNLKVIALLSTGYNTINIEDCNHYGIKVCNIPEYCTREVVEHTMALILGAARRIPLYHQKVNDGKWNFCDIPPISRLYGKQICLFGFGKIAKEVSKVCNALGMQVGVVSGHLEEKEAKEYQVSIFTKEEAQKNADIIVNHMALTEATKLYFDKKFFDKLEKKPLFINVGRGGSVDEPALVAALDEGRIWGAGLDLLSSETPELKGNPLCNRENVIITPHAAFYSEESMYDMCEKAVDNMMNTLLGQTEKVSAFINGFQ